MIKRMLVTSTLVLGIILTTASTTFAQQYYNGHYQAPQAYNPYYSGQYYNNVDQQRGYTPAGYYQPVYNQPVYDPYYNQPVYDPYYNQVERRDKINKAIKYGAIGAGAGYLLSGEGKRAKNALVGGGIGAAMGYFLGNRF
jgi:hypothetical protein